MSKYIFKSLTPSLMVKNVNKSVEFYEKLGFQKIMTVPEEGSFDWAMLGKDQAYLMLQRKERALKEFAYLEKRKTGGTFTLYIETTDVKTFYGKEEFVIKDSDGYILVFASYCEPD